MAVALTPGVALTPPSALSHSCVMGERGDPAVHESDGAGLTDQRSERSRLDRPFACEERAGEGEGG